MVELQSFARVTDAGYVRLAQLAEALLADMAMQDEEGAARLTESILNLRFGLETAAQVPAGSPEQQATLGYLIETYGLNATFTDPFLRPLLPPIPDTGATVRYRVRYHNGRATQHNAKAMSAGATLIF